MDSPEVSSLQTDEFCHQKVDAEGKSEKLEYGPALQELSALKSTPSYEIEDNAGTHLEADIDDLAMCNELSSHAT